MSLRRWWVRRKFRRQKLPVVRPWALLTPVVVLLIALPLLRPLRHPDPRGVSADESARLATVQSIVRHGTLAVDHTDFARDPSLTAKVARGGHVYSDQPPMLAVLLSGSYWVMTRLGLTFRESPHLVTYLLTLLGAALPVAVGGGMVYRMGRLFELPRPWRAGLALACVLGTGLISYATVLNAHAPAAALVICAAACLMHVSLTNRRLHGSIWIAAAGLCAALAATIDPPATVFLLLLLPVVVAFRWPLGHRLGAALAYAAGAAVPVLIHVSLVSSTGGDPWEPLGLGVEAVSRAGAQRELDAPPAPAGANNFDQDDEPARAWAQVGVWQGRLVGAMLGSHGVFSHFPVLVFGVIGLSVVMHRHWPATTKLLAAATIGAGVAIVLTYAVGETDWGEAMFASRWFVVFLPLTLFWSGAWLRRHHRPATWATAGVLLAFSAAVSIVGATGPLPRDGFRTTAGADRYTAAAAVHHLIHPPQFEPDPPAVAEVK